MTMGILFYSFVYL